MSPFAKQCFVVVGASINMSQIGMVMGFAAALLPQLREPGSTIPIDDNSASWLAALPGFALIIGNLTMPTLSAKFGRKKATMMNILLIISGWSCIAAAQNLFWLLIGRLLQGISAGMGSCITPIIIGELTSPKNRGAFTITMSVIMATGTLTVHSMGMFGWRLTALCMIIISITDLIMVSFMPESPSWLAEKGRYAECERVFQWLRGDETAELSKLIQRNVKAQSEVTRYSIKGKIRNLISISKQKEFYKPIIIMAHLFTMGQVGGINILAPYVGIMVSETIGKEFNATSLVFSVDLQRVFSSVLAVFIIRKLRRRTMLFLSCGINASVFIITALYLYARSWQLLPFDHPAIGGLLIHMLIMTVAIGSLPLPFTIAGEIFSLKYRSLSSGISSAICSVVIFVVIKTFPYLISTVNLSGAYCIYSGIMIYCLSVVWFILPETKDRTLQDIEEEFKGKIEEDVGANEPLKVIKYIVE